MIGSIVLLIILTLVNAFFAMSEIAIITLNDAKVEAMAERGHKGAKKIMKLTKDSSGFLATIQVGVTLAGFLSSASAATAFTAKLSGVLDNLSFISPSLASTLSTVIITVILSYFSLVLGELVPKKIGMAKAEAISFKVAGVLLCVKAGTKPFVWLLTKSTNAVTRLFGINPNLDERTVTAEEILMMVDVGGEKGVIEENERDMIANIFDFGDTTASEVMTHRTEVVAVENTASIDELVALTVETGRSRIPLFEEDIDTVLGIIYVKDLLQYVGKEEVADLKLTDFMRDAYFIPEGKNLSELFEEMTSKKIQMAVVVDEYGGTAGIVTMEDILESIVGNIQDEYDNEEEEYAQVSDNTYTVDGTMPIDEVSDLIEVELPEGDYDTLAGLLVSELGYIPKSTDHPTVNLGRVSLTVEKVEDRRISRVLIVITPEEKTEEEEE